MERRRIPCKKDMGIALSETKSRISQIVARKKTLTKLCIVKFELLVDFVSFLLAFFRTRSGVKNM